MTNITLNIPQAGFQPESQSMATIFSNIFQAFVPTDSNAEEKTNFLDAWVLSNNGQG